ncbi:MAG TPA: FUSC family protein, partial [Solirubrobacteraceae bacterium]|nr:FUSC family protein [Solirubrobacteraceae bacterium]
MPRLRERDLRPFGDRAGPLIEEAAERSRVSMRTRVERLRVSWRLILQAGVAAGVAWVIATDVFGHQRPFFAPVAAIITLGLTISQRGRRAVELAIGVAVGVAVGDLLVLVIGVGPAQLSLVVMLAFSIAIFIGSGQMLANQAAVSAALVATLQPPTDGVTFARFLDALAGGVVALVVNALVLP